MATQEPIEYPFLEMPPNVMREKITIWSLGVPLDADIYHPKNIAEGEKLPGIVTTHGWGGNKQTAERYAALFASSGKVVICFSHGSWGDSQGRVIPVDEVPALDQNNESMVKVRMIRDLVDPIDWVQNFIAAIDYLEGEPHIDVERIGGWGTSYGGGIVVAAAAQDERIKAMAIQVPMVFNPPLDFLPLMKQRAIQVARGEIAQLTDEFPGMVGTPHYARMRFHKPGDYIRNITIPTMIIDAGEEEFFDTTISGKAAHQYLQSQGVECYYEVIPGIKHYGIYFDGYERGSTLAQDWFSKHL
ncbi:MAG TPA: hypothetical protein DCS93_20640 [Microscillaceae bacterium]|nr:hypothetical protein [Microscillaceae bacterium]